MHQHILQVENKRLNLGMVGGIYNMLEHDKHVEIAKSGKLTPIPSERKRNMATLKLHVGFSHKNFWEFSGWMNDELDCDFKSYDGKKASRSVEFQDVDPTDTNNRKTEVIEKTFETGFGKFTKKWPKYHKDDKVIICEYSPEILEVLNPNMEVEYLYLEFVGDIPEGIDIDKLIDIHKLSSPGVVSWNLLPIYDIVKKSSSCIEVYFSNEFTSKYNLVFLDCDFYKKLDFLNSISYLVNRGYTVEFKNDITGDDFKSRYKTLRNVEYSLTYTDDGPCFAIVFHFEGFSEIITYVPIDDMDGISGFGKSPVSLCISPRGFRYEYKGVSLTIDTPDNTNTCSEYPIKLEDFLIDITPPRKDLTYCALYIGKKPDFYIGGFNSPLVQNCQYLKKEAGNKCHYIDGRCRCRFDPITQRPDYCGE